ncbi:type VI secretion system baseplate subunit TssG [Pseudoduganella buxea]|nr:type VI secretion system baseplate subunit TssG [Pseudoduganella buxea]GGC13436.1 hypothetical protein GCM10011572_38560 [Pseudoduganella buxea]
MDSLLQHLLAAPGDFDFVQAVDVLAQRARRAADAGDGAADAGIALATAIELGFRAAPLEGAAALPGGPARLTTNFLGLAGPHEPLPAAYVDMVRAQMLAHDSGTADFLGIFQHRLLSTAFQAASAVRSVGAFTEPDDSPLAPALRALMGVTGEMAGGDLPPALLGAAPIAAQQRRSLDGLCALLRQQFGVPVTGRKWAGRWVNLPPALQTTLGRLGSNDMLGDGAVLGRRAWDWGGGVGITIGPVPPAEQQALLPEGTWHAPLAALCDWYLGPGVVCEVGFATDGAAPDLQLGETALGQARFCLPAGT